MITLYRLCPDCGGISRLSAPLPRSPFIRRRPRSASSNPAELRRAVILAALIRGEPATRESGREPAHGRGPPDQPRTAIFTARLDASQTAKERPR